MQASKSPALGGCGRLCRVAPDSPVFQPGDASPSSQAPGCSSSLPAGKPSGFSLPPPAIRWAKKSRDFPANLVGKAAGCHVGDGTRPRGAALGSARPSRSPAPSPFPRSRCGAVAVALLASPALVFHTQFLFCTISARPGVRFLGISRK